jgi:hypothetical protein
LKDNLTDGKTSGKENDRLLVVKRNMYVDKNIWKKTDRDSKFMQMDR